ncbi:MAG: carbamoyl-phosphate synthase domain-containing protein [Planctomycetaceae bacterium]
MTYPLIGNYGINREDVESGRLSIRGFVVGSCAKPPAIIGRLTPSQIT